MRRLPHLASFVVASAILLAPSHPFAAPFPVSDHYESAQVHPLEISPDGTRLFVANTADAVLSVFDLTPPTGPQRIAEIPVGVEPVTVRARTNDEVWVVNHISDSISIVKVSERNVVRTLLVGDEPTDVAFVPAQNAAFVCVSQEDLIRVYDTQDLHLAPTTILLAMSDPRSLALSPDKSTLYVCALDSQNRTTSIPFATVAANGGLPPPNPPMAQGLPAAPRTALIVKFDGTAWRDEIGRSWNAVVPYTLLDQDVIRISTASRTVLGAWTGVGTTLFNVAVSPLTGRVYVTNEEASNEVRFEPNLQGKFLKNRITWIDPSSGTVTPVHLNPQINYSVPAGNPSERAQSLAIPTDVTVSSDGTRVYVAALGSRKVGVLDADGNVVRRIVVGDGPNGLALDEARNRLYVVNRFSSNLAVVNLANDGVTEIPLGFDPSAAQVITGRHFLYDGENSSAHGDLACASCHTFGTMDNIAWDLGNPQGTFVPPSFPGFSGFHPMKGPMTTQSLKGLVTTEPFHWRGDRANFQAFNPAFVSLMGRSSPLATSDMQAFEAFVMTMKYPPNPNRHLDGTHLPSLNGANPAHGEQLFMTGGLVGGANCVNCHQLPTGENGLIIPATALREDQDMKVPQLRNMYEKTRFDNTAATNVRGFGYTHDGAVDDLFSFLDFPGFNFQSASDQSDVAAFLLTFNTGAPAALGAQWTMDGTNEADGIDRVNTLVTLANANTIGLIAKGRDGGGHMRGWAYQPGSGWQPDRQTETPVLLATLLTDAGLGTERTFTAVLKGNELRMGIDEDGDGYFDQDERDVGSDPFDANSTPPDLVGAPLALAPSNAGPSLWLSGPNPASLASSFGYRLGSAGEVRLDVFDLAGRRVRTLVDQARGEPGRFQQAWDLRDLAGRRVAAGVYFARLTTPHGTAGERVVVLR